MHLALLAGGRSTRMGRDKAKLMIAGEPLLVRLARFGVEAGLPVLICGRPRPADWFGPAVTFIPDAQVDEGPLRGLEAALSIADEVLLLACDLPCFTPVALAWLCAQTRGVLGTAICCAGELEPLASRYTAAGLPRLVQELAQGRRSARNLLTTSGFHLATVPPELVHAFADADDPGDWQRLGLS